MARTGRPKKGYKTVRKTIAMPDDTAELLEDLAKRQFKVKDGAYKRGDFLALWLPRIKLAMDAEVKADELAAAERERYLAAALAREMVNP